jgi:predicted Fe-S protein YdhL (DUF1289 family)
MVLMMSLMTPCVGICSTSIAGSVCRGCKRYAHEVIRWNSYTATERESIWRRLEQFRCTIISNWLEVFDDKLLKAQLEKQRIKFNPALDARAWAYDLLRAGASQIEDPAAYGLRLLPRCQDMALIAVNEEIEKEYLALSEAHYARYFSDVRTT